MVGREQLAHPQRVVRDVPGQAAEVLALRRLRGTQQLGERVDAGELVPVAVVLDPDGAHHGSDPGRKNDNDERGGGGRREKYRNRRGEGRREMYRAVRTEPSVWHSGCLSLLPSPQEGTTRQRGHHQGPHFFCLAYVPISCAVPTTCPCIAASTSRFLAPAFNRS